MKKNEIKISFVSIMLFLFISCNKDIETIASKGPNIIPQIKSQISEVRIYQFEIDSTNPLIIPNENGKDLKATRIHDVLTYTSSDNHEIIEITNCFSDSLAPVYFCSYSGKVIIKINETDEIEIKFNLDDDCRYYTYSYKDELYSFKITLEGQKYLKQFLN